MTTRMTATLGGLLLLGFGGGATGQQEHPGFVDLDRLVGPDQAEVLVDVRVGGWLLGWARAAASQSGDPELAVLSSIDSVRVRVVHLDERRFTDQARALADQLATEGWEEFARVREDDRWVQVMIKGSQERIHGITVMATESSDEAVFVNIAGRLDPADVARILKDRDLIRADLGLDLDV